MLQPGLQLGVRGQRRGQGTQWELEASKEVEGGLPVPPRPGKQVTPYQLGKQTPKQSVGLDFDEPDTLPYKK